MLHYLQARAIDGLEKKPDTLKGRFDEEKLADDHVLTDAAERDAIDQRREVPIDDPDDDR